MILSTNAFNWAALRSGLGLGDFMATLTPEREVELFKQYNEWRREKGLTEEAMPTAGPSSAPKKVKKTRPRPSVDILSSMITQIASNLEAEEAAEEALVQDALDGADEIVEGVCEPVPAEVEEEIEADEPEPIQEGDNAEPDEPEPIHEDDAPMDTVDDAVSSELLPPSADFAAVIRSLPKTSDPAFYRQIVSEYGDQALPLAQASLKEATKKHRGTAAIRSFIAWLEQENNFRN